MIRKFMHIWFVIVFFSLVAVSYTPASASANQTSIVPGSTSAIIEKYRQAIPQLMAEQHIPGLAVAVTDENGVLWSEGFGYTDNNHKVAVKPDTIFSVQSASKNFTAMAVLMAVQEELLDLDAPITTYLPDFTVHSIFEEHPERKITVRMLLSHTAGFTMEAPVGNNFDLGHVDFDEHVKSISQTWLRFPVGTGYAYSNVGYSLAGYILQKVSGQPFPQYVEEHLLHPVGMGNSSFDMAQIRLNPNRAIGHAKPYPKVPLEIPLIPEGGLYTSVNDMAKYIQFHLNRGSVNGPSVLKSALLDEMYTVPSSSQGGLEGYGLGVARTTWYNGRNAILFCHGGGGFGFLADLWWLPELKIGITVLTNSSGHNLQGDLALQILSDFVHDPNSIYYNRMMSLPDRAPVVEGDGHYRPPYNLTQSISQHALLPSASDPARWKQYLGDYGATVWGALDPTKPSVQVSELGTHLYLKAADTAKTLELYEVEPGLFFAENGEALDFRGPVSTWRNVKLTRLCKGAAPWQKAILVACGLVFASAIILPSVRGVVRRLRRRSSSDRALRWWTGLATVFMALTSLFGLVSIGLLFALPYIIYSGFIGWLDLPLWQKLLSHAPFALLVAGIGFLALVATAWKNRWWSHGEWIYTLVVGIASLVILVFLSYWRLIGLSLR